MRGIISPIDSNKTTLGDNYGQDTRILPWVPITKTQSEQFMQLTTRGTWFCIGAIVVAWITIRFIGPAFGWWEVVY
ncbi:DUF2839 domain-containing protein [Nodularia sp. NIES-3585]|uniref:DUF2839 domain-containing protein n=1 Tax=Nodularia sp. NIES-3585 TaxID=1973477 RepID=UPI0020CF9F32|nr:DUF2839 domain-containing protein [Nodularia sp. NIES-3585]